MKSLNKTIGSFVTVALASLLALQACEDDTSNSVDVETLTSEEAQLIDFGDNPSMLTCADVDTETSEELFSDIPSQMKDDFVQSCDFAETRPSALFGKGETDTGVFLSLYETRVTCTEDRRLCMICRYNDGELESCDLYH